MSSNFSLRVVVAKIDQVVVVAVGTATVVGQWSGAQRPARARAAAGSAARVAVLSILPVLLLVALCAPAAVRLFARDTVVVTAAVSYLRIVAVSSAENRFSMTRTWSRRP